MSPRKVASFTQAEIDRIFKAAEKTGLNVRIERPDGTVITTTGKAETAVPVTTADDELEQWRRKKGHANQA